MAGSWTAIYVNVVAFTSVGLKLLSSEEFLELDVIDNIMLMPGCHIVLYRGLESFACVIVTSVMRNVFGQ